MRTCQKEMRLEFPMTLASLIVYHSNNALNSPANSNVVIGGLNIPVNKPFLFKCNKPAATSLTK